MLRSICVIAMGIVAAGNLLAQEEDLTITVRLLDPRVVANTPLTMSIGVGEEKTDIIASRTLTRSERDALAKLTQLELTEGGDLPYCGHYPAYGIVYRRKNGTIAKTHTVCGLCMTWTSEGRLMVLKGKKTIEYLETLLPLPDYFSNPKTTKDLVVFAKNKGVPYYELENK